MTSYGSNYYRYRGFPPPRTPKGVPRARLVHAHFFSPALGRRRSYLIYLPPGYSAAAARGRRFPVYYFLHGSPGAPKVVFDAAKMGVDYDVLLHEHRIKPFLMVIPDGRNGTFASDTEWTNTRRGGPWGSFVMDVVHAVDARWATIPTRRARMIAGYSEGGFGALNLSLHHLATFGSLESWSGYVIARRGGPLAGEPPAVVRANEPNRFLARVAGKVRRDGLRAYVYTGRSDPARPEVVAYAHQLAAAGAHVTLSVFPGGHSWRLWRDRCARMLVWASKELAT